MICTETDLGYLDWYTANEECENLNGFSDWRLPTINELIILCTVRHKIKGVSSNCYWSNHEVNEDTATSYFLLYDDGYPTDYTKDLTRSVRAVRAF